MSLWWKRTTTLSRHLPFNVTSFTPVPASQEKLFHTYVAELRRIAERCNFGGNLENTLCDRLVCGIQDSCIQRRLLGEPDLTFWKAFHLAQSLESADRDAEALQATPPRVNAVTSSHHNRNTRNSRKPVVKGRGPSLFGQDWLQHITLDWKTLNNVQTRAATDELTLSAVLTHHKAAFSDELGIIQGTSAKLHVDSQTRPRFFKPRAVPYSMRGKVEQKLDRLQKQGIIRPVTFSDWAAPIVPVLKKDGSVRICGDYRLTVNQIAKLETYPLPRIEDLLASLSGGKTFTKLDLTHAYQQVELEENSRKFVTINTHRGLFECTPDCHLE